VRPPQVSPLKAEDNVIIGNTVLMARRMGISLPRAGRVNALPCATPARRSWSKACGSNGCEYMTGGVAVILGAIGREFRRGHDRRDGVSLRSRGCRTGQHEPRDAGDRSRDGCPLGSELKGLIQAHVRETDSRKGGRSCKTGTLELRKLRSGLPQGNAGQAGASDLRGYGRDPGGVTQEQQTGPRYLGVRSCQIANKNHGNTAIVPETGQNLPASLPELF
jgi:glutamate synthase (NADPH/NADH) large chain